MPYLIAEERRRFMNPNDRNLRFFGLPGRLIRIALVLALPLVLLSSSQSAPPAGKIPLILDTDIGDDIDDTWALTLILKSPEFDLKLVTTDYGNTEYRARIVAKLLQVAGRTDVPIGIGIKQNDKEGGQAGWVKDYDLSKYPGKIHRDGVQALIDVIKASSRPVTLLCIGPAPNVKAALVRDPGIAGRARFVGMYGSIRRGAEGETKPIPEWNVKCDVAAFRSILQAPWDVTITPLDTCGQVRLTGAKYATLLKSQDPLIIALIENYRLWLGKKVQEADRASSILFDTAAVYLVLPHDLMAMEDLGIEVADNAMMTIRDTAKKIHCATSWKDLPAYEDFLVKRYIQSATVR
jgi:inosine-uridine nucleoside N-ribohydrolase